MDYLDKICTRKLGISCNFCAIFFVPLGKLKGVSMITPYIRGKISRGSQVTVKFSQRSLVRLWPFGVAFPRTYRETWGWKFELSTMIVGMSLSLKALQSLIYNTETVSSEIIRIWKLCMTTKWWNDYRLKQWFMDPSIAFLQLSRLIHSFDSIQTRVALPVLH